MRGARAGLVLISITAVAAFALARRAPPPEARVRAERFLKVAIDSEIALNYSASMRLIQDALRADPTFVPAMFMLNRRFLSDEAPGSVLAFVDSIASQLNDRALARCYGDLARFARGYARAAPPTPATRDARDCEDFFLGVIVPAPDTISALAAAERLAARYPEQPAAAQRMSDALRLAENWPKLAQWGRRWASSPTQPMLRAMGTAVLAMSILDPDSAIAAAHNSLERPEMRSPGYRMMFRGSFHADLLLQRSPGRAASPELTSRVTAFLEGGHHDARLQLEARDSVTRLLEGAQLALWYLDRGRLNEAAAVWPVVVALADSMGDDGRRAYVHMRYGRTLVKLGRADEARRELLLARTLGARADRPNIQKEVEHNLFHLYDAERRDADAVAAGTAFAHYASLKGLHGVRLISKYDLGMFFRARGELEQSRRYFEQMLADVDSLRLDRTYGGEYYELTGELDLARKYYVAALRGDPYRGRAEAGLVRVSLALSDTGAAIAYARVHDLSQTTLGFPEAAPLLPGVLASVGRTAEARAELEKARVAARSRGQVSAWAALTQELAQLDLLAGDAQRAALRADSAVSEARRVAAADVAFRARLTGAVARGRDPAGRRAAVGLLESLAREADRRADPQLRAGVRRALAEALANDGKWRASLGQFQLAADAIDSVAGRIALDPAQAGYRSVQRAVSDGALSTVARFARGAEAARLFGEWSTRRKGRGYRDGAQWRETSLSPGTAMVDLAMLDTTVVAGVATTGGTTIVTLPVRADSVRRLIGLMTSRMDLRVGSVVDTAHAVFPLAVSHELYRVLIAPLLPHLGSARAVTLIPDGALWLVPFEALVSSLPAGGGPPRFVIDDFGIDVATTPAADREPPAPRAPRVMAVAPSVDSIQSVGASVEVDAIAAAYAAERTDIYRGSRASEDAVRSMPSSVGVLHFATHAIANESDPSMSWLALSPDGRDDGRLHAFEIDRLDLHGALVILDACETASGRALEGEGVLSLSRSFLRAGSSATIATLWPVGAGALPLMREFYAALGRGSDARTALRMAKRARRAAGASPFEWGAYVYVGRRPR